MHSSKMRTAHSSSRGGAGVYLVWGVYLVLGGCIWSWRGCTWSGGCIWSWGVYLVGGVPGPGGVSDLVLGGVSQHALRQTPPLPR